jgi:cupin 2 domain-containing protein
MDAGNLFAGIPGDIDQELFTELLKSDRLSIQRIVSRGQVSPESGWYDQHDNEWVVVLKGEAKVICDNGDEFHLLPGSYLNIPAHTRHRVAWTTPDSDTVWLAIHYF